MYYINIYLLPLLLLFCRCGDACLSGTPAAALQHRAVGQLHRGALTGGLRGGLGGGHHLHADDDYISTAAQRGKE